MTQSRAVSDFEALQQLAAVVRRLEDTAKVATERRQGFFHQVDLTSI